MVDLSLTFLGRWKPRQSDKPMYQASTLADTHRGALVAIGAMMLQHMTSSHIPDLARLADFVPLLSHTGEESSKEGIDLLGVYHDGVAY